MKKIIDGKIYNTETAMEICDIPSPCSNRDFNYHDTKLYQTKKGAFFLAGEGGPLSMWAKPADGNGMSGGKGIRVIDKDEARSYMEKAGCKEELFAQVGLEVEEG